MKIQIFVVLVLCTYTIGFAQNNPLEKIKIEFNKKFPEATNVMWEKENAHNYEANFKLKNAEYSANFDDKGEWLETESPFTYDQLPEKIKTAFSASHKGATIKAVSKIETSKRGVLYEVEIKQGIKSSELFYTSEGLSTKE